MEEEEESGTVVIRGVLCVKSVIRPILRCVFVLLLALAPFVRRGAVRRASQVVHLELGRENNNNSETTDPSVVAVFDLINYSRTGI